MPEVMAMPERADEQVFYQILKMAEKSMLQASAKSRANGKRCSRRLCTLAYAFQSWEPEWEKATVTFMQFTL